jgi:hypothetical protein
VSIEPVPNQKQMIAVSLCQFLAGGQLLICHRLFHEPQHARRRGEHHDGERHDERKGWDGPVSSHHWSRRDSRTGSTRWRKASKSAAAARTMNCVKTFSDLTHVRYSTIGLSFSL